MDLKEKLGILADAAKYDASCSSSGAKRRDSSGGKGVGSAGGTGICHSYAPDGRCISLLKILLTNVCIYDCHYCINRRSSDVRRARFSVEEVVQLTLDFYKRNYIEGLFLSSGIVRDADFTMEEVIRVARELRETHHFRGYIHLKTIPEASQELIEEAGKYADRISINIELPSEEGIKALAPEKDLRRTQQAMGGIRSRIENGKEEQKDRAKRARTVQTGAMAGAPKVYATGQSTQMIVGADQSNDELILQRSDHLYRSYRLKRVYYSAFSPIPASSVILPAKSPPLIREHRLYQADWLLRFYGFEVGELTPKAGPEQGQLSLDLDPKLAWALRFREWFPVDLNRGSREQLLRIPGLGVRNVERVIKARRWSSIRLGDLTKLRVNLKKCLPFIMTPDHSPGRLGLDNEERLRARYAPAPEQLEFDFSEAGRSALSGEI
ncbi:putative DNA modification/repair radical SAM protein [Verrucomicrobiales bacterium BCK34]|nr:putative DNA modification/repair radical SAM protein [Verrucomicrobiales bacterium BCK34]